MWTSLERLHYRTLSLQFLKTVNKLLFLISRKMYKNVLSSVALNLKASTGLLGFFLNSQGNKVFKQIASFDILLIIKEGNLTLYGPFFQSINLFTIFRQT